LEIAVHNFEKMDDGRQTVKAEMYAIRTGYGQDYMPKNAGTLTILYGDLVKTI